MTPTVLLLSGLFTFCLNQKSFTPIELVKALRAFQVGLSTSPYLVENGLEIFAVIAERDWGRE